MSGLRKMKVATIAWTALELETETEPKTDPGTIILITKMLTMMMMVRLAKAIIEPSACVTKMTA